ncbi:SDR family oxidoreductase [Mesorhizobium sp. B2-4-9]|uniref:SDR family oxidoreductase n=1 Tax=Mesorhizobium sp. B2-4-9 TaxID=2589940 RepID=UPI001125CF66|nr:SDR family oxidoreductase [Mesorhizobium sp. B2-4-9]TPL21158.1 SDR family oxidoreductase [Mesorhizobium sp. B2-4-9]
MPACHFREPRRRPRYVLAYATAGRGQPDRRLIDDASWPAHQQPSGSAKWANFSGKSVLVVGGSSGIGFAVAATAVSAGGDVTIASRSAEKLASAAASLGGKAKVAVVDATDTVSVDDFFARVDMFDHVFVTAADVSIRPVADASVDDAQSAMNSKFWGIYRIARAARIRPGGSLGVVAGFRSHRPAPGLALMSAINAAIEGLVIGLALDLKPVRVNAVSPAMVDTPLWSGMEHSARQAMMDRLASLYPAGVVARPDDIAQMLLALAVNPYATGTVVTLDGGASLV